MPYKSVANLLLVLLLLLNVAYAQTIVLPDQLIEISEEAFMGDTSISEVIIPYGALSIGKSAFAGCSNLEWITIPQTVDSLGEDFIKDCAPDLLIRTAHESVACDYAQNNMVDYQADSVYRALLIGQTYPDIYPLRLSGPDNDVIAMEQCLNLFGDSSYHTTVCMNLSADGILEKINNTFGNATSVDVSLFYYSGHGISSDDSSQQGALLGADNEGYITANELRTALDQISGRKIVIIDACYSGNMLSSNTAAFPSQNSNMTRKATSSANTFVDSFISTFSKRKRSSLAADSYYVLTAAADDEESFENTIGDRVMGLFTSTLVTGCGYNISEGNSSTMTADINDNEVLTLHELYQHTRKALIVDGQHVQVFPSDCQWFGILRK